MTKTSLVTRRAAVLASLLPAISACNRDRRKRIAVIPMGRAHVFWQSVHAGAIKAARESEVEIEWNGPAVESDMAGQLQIVESMINRKVDAIALAPIDRRALVNAVERATRAGIPVVIFDSGIDTDVFIARIATDNYKAGEMAAQRMGEILGGAGKVAIVASAPGAASTMAREQGFDDYVRKNFAGLQIVDKRFGEAEVARSLKVTENMLTAFPDLSALFASNETSSVGASQALKARQGQRSVRLVGFDSSPTLLADLRAGVIDSLVVQHPFRMGYESVMAAVRQFRGEKIDKIQNMPPRLVTRDNIDQPEVREQLNPDLNKYLS